MTRRDKSNPLHIFEELWPETNDLALYAGTPRVINFAHMLHDLRSQIEYSSEFTEVTRGKVDAANAAAEAALNDNDSTGNLNNNIMDY